MQHPSFRPGSGWPRAGADRRRPKPPRWLPISASRVDSRVGRIAVAGLLAVAVLLGPAPAAEAHSTLLFATPAVDGAVPTSPEQVQLVFDQAVLPADSALRLHGPDGAQIPMGPAVSGENGRTVAAPVLEELEVGQYVVDWTVTADDGDTMMGTFRFGVGSSSGLTLGGGDQPEVSGLRMLTLLRIVLFAGLAVALGGLVGGRLVQRSAAPATWQGDPQPWLLAGSILGLVAALGLAVALLGEGSIAAGLSGLRPLELLESTPGRVAVVEVLGFAGAGIAVLRRRRALAGLLLVGVAAAEGFRAHPQAASPGWGALLIFVHLSAAAVWVGALVHVVRVGLSRRARDLPAVEAVAAYARLALWLFLLVVATGTVSGLVLAVPAGLGDTLFGTSYGRWLLAKLTLVVVVTGLALGARRHLVRRPSLPQPARAARVEVAGLAGVLVVSALLTSLAPPVRRDLELPFPPPPVGPVSAAGGRAGWIGIGVTASEGQLLVRLTTPDRDPSLDGEGATDYDLVANFTGPDDTAPRALELRRCGRGCFVAPAEWERGRNTITLKADSSDWEGGTTALTVAWPARQAPELLRRTVRIMRDISGLTIYEQVTSDTNRGLGDEMRLELTGAELLESDPYGSGVAPTVVVLKANKTTGEAELALAYPGEGTYVRLTLDHHGRIVRETLTAPNHLTTRTIVYPEEEDEHHDHDHEH